MPAVYLTGSPRRELGSLLALLGRIDDAVALLRAALAADTGLGARPYVVARRLDLSGLLARADALLREITVAERTCGPRGAAIGAGPTSAAPA
ncbi:MAG: hypothetical protein ACXV3S_08390 [Kineosporiaceae bacterium]